MNWQSHIRSAEEMLDASRVPSSLEIMTLIKKVNPTGLMLQDTEREYGYQVKNRLQNLLLEHYGDSFHLEPHPLSDGIVLIKHSALPSIDACHTELESLSPRALQMVGGYRSPVRDKKGKRPPKESPVKQSPERPGTTELLREARQLLERYEFPEAEALLSGIAVAGAGDLPSLVQAAHILVREMGAYRAAIDMLLSQPKQFLKENQIRELLAVAYYHDGGMAEARAVFDTLPARELGKDSLCARAALALHDGNLSLAQLLLKMAGEKEGFVDSLASLKKEIEGHVMAEADAVSQRAQAAWEMGQVDDALSLARKALEYCPNHAKARDIVVAFNEKNEASEIERLWGEVGSAKECQAKIDLLTRLLDLDCVNRDKIQEMIGDEQIRGKKELISRRLQELRILAEEAKWRECYDILCWFSREDQDPVYAEAYAEACSVSPYFSVLYRNKQLQKLSDRHAKETWLQFVKAKSLLASGEARQSFPIMEEVKEHFQSYPEFSEEYGRLLAVEREISRAEIGLLVVEVESPDCSLAEATRIFGQIRKKMAVLPGTEKSELTRKMKALLTALTPEPSEESQLEAYREALLLGDAEKAASLREQIAQKPLVAGIDSEIAESFRIEWEPVTVTLSDDLPVDLDSAPPLVWQFATDRQIVFREDDHSFIFVDLQDMTADRYASPHFEHAVVADGLASRKTFLFRKGGELLEKVWRAELCGRNSSFTACFDLCDVLSLGQQHMVGGIFMSSDRATDYYCTIAHRGAERPGRFAKHRLGSNNGTGHGIEIQGAPYLFARRLTTDKFIVGANDETRVVTKTLATEKNLIMEPLIWEVDETNGYVFHIYENLVRRSDLQFSTFLDFRLSAAASCLFNGHTVLGLCPETNTALLAYYDRCALYDFANNMVSNHFHWGRLACANPAKKWYYYDYCAKNRSLTLRQISNRASFWQWTELNPDTLGGGDREKKALEIARVVYYGYPPTCDDSA